MTRTRDLSSLRDDDLRRVLAPKPDRKPTAWIDVPRYFTRSFEK
jgi:hypothetical protein